MELTKEHFDQAVKGLAMQDSLNELIKTVAEVKKIVDVHTTALDTLLTASKNKADAGTVSSERFERIERWAGQVGQKLGIKLEL